MKTLADLHIFSDLRELSTAAAEFVAKLSAEAIAERGRFTVAFSGGSLPKLVCPPLVAEPLKSQIDWAAWHVFQADERCVPLTSPESNYALTREYLFDHVNIPAAQIYPLNDSLIHLPEMAAAVYQATLATVFRPAPGQFPCFDLVLLGMGDDGHTASLFPRHPLLKERFLWVASISDSPKLPPERITLTLPVLNNARHIAFITTGKSKAAALQQVVFNPVGKLPAQMVKPQTGSPVWFIDGAAAGKLAPER